MAQIKVKVWATTDLGKDVELGEAEISWDMVLNKIYFPISQFPALSTLPKSVKVSDGMDTVAFGMREYYFRDNGDLAQASYHTNLSGGATLWLYIYNK